PVAKRGWIMKILMFALFTGCLFFQGARADVPIDNFHQIKDGVYRGARPSTEGLQALKDLGIRTIINLDDDTDEASIEKDTGTGLGIQTISEPMSAFLYPDDEQVTRVLTELNNPANYPVFVHCQFGEDRTGIISAIYRVEYMKWTPKNAHDEMLALGFHTY